jgi:succinate-semialdehyde dehydrogenase / glutarate-semialdehyde dehydrogenase
VSQTSTTQTSAHALPDGLPTGMVIGARAVEGEAGRFDVHDPATGEVIVSLGRASTDQVTQAVDAASAALPEWSASTPRRRSEVLRRAFELMAGRREELARLISLEMGKALVDARAEVDYAAEFFRWFAEEAVRIDGSLRRSPSGTNRILTFARPVGVCLLLTPWNFPAAMLTRKLGPAVAAGCTAVVKPAQLTPLTTLALVGILAEAGLPAGVVNVLLTDRASDVSGTALADPRVRKLSFTGSTPVGRGLLAQASRHVLRTSMELGGNAPFIVCADADVEAAVSGAMLAKMRNGGQACTAANRFLVHADVLDEFTAGLTARMAALRVGPGLDPETGLGPMVSRKAVDEIAAMVSAAVDDGATLALGGTAHGPGFFYDATVLTGVASDAAVLSQELFGPVAPVVRVTSDDEAVEIANAVDVGLTGYLYTRDLARGLRLAERLEVGMVGLNRGLVSDPAAPFGGVKESGLGREGGYEGITEYLETCYVATEW